MNNIMKLCGNKMPTRCNRGERFTWK